MNTPERIIYTNLQALKNNTGLDGKWLAGVRDKLTDGKIELSNGTQQKTFPVVVKNEATNTHLVHFVNLNEKFPDIIVIAKSIYPAIREQLRKLGLNYVDSNGNCYIKQSDWLFLIDGQKAKNPVLVNKDRAFTKTGLQLVFHFLVDERYIKSTYRQMAEDYDTALGNINNIVTSLTEQGFLVRTAKKELKLLRKKALLEKWINTYEQKLKPSLYVGSFRLPGGPEQPWRNLLVKNTETQWGSEPAANIITDYLKPVQLTLYTTETITELIEKYRLIPDDRGPLKIYSKFWKFNQDTNTVPPLLIYADLVNSGDPRNVYTAKNIYDRFLKTLTVG
ncbi:type IV toxin-antitoxin system AbiEi family antitoxin [Mucilaginibacter ginsenosidivorax]|uniref:Uncharacterized protein n=1 Tax=Mucilaginibacter ginsenosidivorax TaxID=862126 RepID=A0A5B8W3S1_9SPHI|nr:type IV toxin-antitoxin system AbiEi family antitoxin [Mucilaginibacter ginsenosidivorax]QEC76958.1 hypothetical protein FSB76_13760 [Mucilaginibacter ginsenosidivorax]